MTSTHHRDVPKFPFVKLWRLSKSVKIPEKKWNLQNFVGCRNRIHIQSQHITSISPLNYRFPKFVHFVASFWHVWKVGNKHPQSASAMELVPSMRWQLQLGYLMLYIYTHVYTVHQIYSPIKGFEKHVHVLWSSTVLNGKKSFLWSLQTRYNCWEFRARTATRCKV